MAWHHFVASAEARRDKPYAVNECCSLGPCHGSLGGHLSAYGFREKGGELKMAYVVKRRNSYTHCDQSSKHTPMNTVHNGAMNHANTRNWELLTKASYKVYGLR